MKESDRLSNVTQKYLNAFDHILEQMIRGMTEAKRTASISRNFIIQMIPHHQAAIEMSENILQYTTDLTLQDIAQQIITEQTKSIEDMRRIEQECSALTNTERELVLYQYHTNQILRTMFAEMRGAKATNQINCDFMWEMIPHHEGAVALSTNALCFSICPELVPILQAIITSQRRGIQQMQRLQRRLGC